MAAAAMRGQVRYGALASMPVIAMVIVVVTVVESLYYGAAKVLMPHGVNLESETIFVGIVRICAALSVYCYMPAYFRYCGFDAPYIRRRVTIEIIGLAAVWISVVMVLW